MVQDKLTTQEKPRDLREARHIVSVFERELPLSPCCNAKFLLGMNYWEKEPEGQILLICSSCDELWEWVITATRQV